MKRGVYMAAHGGWWTRVESCLEVILAMSRRRRGTAVKGGREKKKDDGFDAEINGSQQTQDAVHKISTTAHTVIRRQPLKISNELHPYLLLYPICYRFWLLQYIGTPYGKKPQGTINDKNQSAFMYASEESVREYIALLPSPSLHLPVHLARTSTTSNLHLLWRTEPANIYQHKQIANITANDLPRRHLTSRREPRWHPRGRTRESRRSESRRHTATQSAFQVWIKR